VIRFWFDRGADGLRLGDPRPRPARGSVLLSSDPDRTGDGLGPHEAVIVRLDDR
jgi:hypothetical protein